MPRVLVVDPSRARQAFLRALLETSGAQAVQADSLASALACLRQHADIVLVLVDETLMEPGGRFVSTVRQLSAARVFLMTEAETPDTSGADGYVRRPFTSTWLQSQMRAEAGSPCDGDTRASHIRMGREAKLPARPSSPRDVPVPRDSADRRLRVLVVDDSAVVRAVVRQVLEEDPGLEVVGTASNGQTALDMVAGLEPDLVTLDIDMPVMDGLQALSEIRRSHPTLPVVVFTAEAGAQVHEAQTRGASAVVSKPGGAGGRDEMLDAVRQTLLPRVKALAGVLPTLPEAPCGPTNSPAPRANGTRIDLVAIGVSTGGPEALRVVLADFTPDFPVPVVVVQHMPAEFTRSLAERLSATLPIGVREVCDGDELVAGTVWLAPGGCHLEVARGAGGYRAVLSHEPPENSCRPSVDVLFRSVARTSGPHALGVVMTGMGQDGLRGSEAIHQQGGQIVVQDRASSTVWGMPGAVAEMGLAHAVIPLSDLGLEIKRRVTW